MVMREHFARHDYSIELVDRPDLKQPESGKPMEYHKFKNLAGMNYVGIYVEEIEALSSESKKKNEMIKRWNEEEYKKW